PQPGRPAAAAGDDLLRRRPPQRRRPRVARGAGHGAGQQVREALLAADLGAGRSAQALALLMAVFASSPETFLVEEIPAYPPVGEGSHTFLWIEKQGLTTVEAIKRLARALGVADRDIGYAGMKDRHATTRQWVSVPAVDPAVALAAEIPGCRVLEARRHGNKLRTGHLRGNRFEVVLTEVGEEGALLCERFLALGRDGLPNTYG